MSNIDKTLSERGSRYGEFDGHAFLTQEFKRAMHDHANWNNLADDQKEALDMVAHKIGRIVNGDPDYIDSWTDIIGYVRLVEKRLLSEQEEAVMDKKAVIPPHIVGLAIAILLKAGVISEVDDDDEEDDEVEAPESLKELLRRAAQPKAKKDGSDA